MSRYHKIVIINLTMLFLSSCVPEYLYQPPKIEPVRSNSGRAGFAEIELMASTNCAEIGEVVTFTVRVENQTTTPMTMIGTPPLDIVLSPGGNPSTGPMPPVQRWSASSQYPQSIDPVLAPGETRVYEWRWTADAVYGQEGVLGVGARAVTALRTPGMPYAQAASALVGVGVVWTIGGEAGEIRCADMRR